MSQDGFGPADPRSKLVLIVDDVPDICEFLKLQIGAAGFKVITAGRGEEAIEKLSEKPDVILLDLMMPGCGGLGVLKHLKTLPGPIPAVLVITAYQDQHPVVLEAVKDPNVTQCLRKPVREEVLLAALHRYTKTEPLQGDS